ncbi:MAG: sigma-54 dependent transcriptional regulator [bacterium]
MVPGDAACRGPPRRRIVALKFSGGCPISRVYRAKCPRIGSRVVVAVVTTRVRPIERASIVEASARAQAPLAAIQPPRAPSGSEPAMPPTIHGPRGERVPHVLVVDDESPIRVVCRRVLDRDGYHVEEAADGKAALELLELGEFDVIVTDLKMPELQGLDLLREVKARQPEVEVIMMTAHGTVQDAIEAMKHGALDFLVKPFDLDELSISVAKAIERRGMVREIRTLRKELRTRYHLGRLYGKAQSMQELYELVERFAPTESTILINGESGTGKEVLARTIHFESKRASGPFVAVNCGAIVREIFESELFGHVRGAFTGALTDKAGYFRDANGGTIFLDEVTEMPASAQVKLLRVLQEREVVPVGSTQPIPIDVRVVAASNQDLDAALRAGLLRQDLYFRLNVVRLALPPLRDRLEDIPLLAMHFVEQSAARVGRPQVAGIAPSATEALMAYPWPGNVRELQNCIEYAVALTRGTEVSIEHLPVAIRGGTASVPASPPPPAPWALPAAPAPVAARAAPAFTEADFPTLDQLERDHILRALTLAGGQRKRAAEMLGIDPKTLYRKLLRYDEDGGTPGERAPLQPDSSLASAS